MRHLVAARRTLVLPVAILLVSCGGDASTATTAPTVFETALHYYTTDEGMTPVAVPEPTRIEARLPDGWESSGSGVTRDAGDGPDPAVAISFWAVDAVFIEPCNAVGPHGADPPMMRSLDGLAEAFTLWWQGDALNEWWAWNPPPDLPSTTHPINTTVSGFHARYLEVRIPETVDVESCQGGRYATWRNADDVERRHGPGEVSRIWIVEVGQPSEFGSNRFLPMPATSIPLLVIDASSVGEPSPETLAELEDIIASLRIEGPGAGDP